MPDGHLSTGEADPLEAPKIRSPLLTASVLRVEVLTALVVGLALIPEAIAFSVIAHVDPRMGLFASFTMAVTVSIVGGRRAMISAATGSVALVIAPVAAAHGANYLIATVLLGGLLQIVLGTLGVHQLMRFVPDSVRTGFVNALAILLFVAQLPNLWHVPWVVYPLFAGAVVTIVVFPRLTRLVPGPLVAVALLTVVTVAAGLNAPNVGDKGDLPHSLPSFAVPHVPYSLHTLGIIAGPAISMAIVGLLETLLTARLVDDLTHTGSNKRREACGQGIANIVTSLFGGIGGCAVIGQTMINVKSGARTRLSTFLAGIFLLFLVVTCRPVVSRIPMAALVAIIALVSIATFNWRSIQPRQLRVTRPSETLAMLATVAGTLATRNLAIGVLAGVCITGIASAVHRAQRPVLPADDGHDGAPVLPSGSAHLGSCPSSASGGGAGG